MILNGGAAGEEGLRIATGSYTGNGGYSSTRVILEIDVGFLPKFIFITNDYSAGANGLSVTAFGYPESGSIISISPGRVVSPGGSTTTNTVFTSITAKVDGTVVKLYGSGTSDWGCMNQSGAAYRWVAIG